ncbi:MAG: dTMP kinase [Patescibacteria group bacterium]|nr:dTMP kinase [Patescibacteria group bacterium]
MQRGKFIVIEGGEGSGKDTQIELLREAFERRGDIVFTREPGGTALGERLRSIVQDRSSEIVPEADLLLYSADRAQHIAEVVVPALMAGRHVISNRFALSTIAYQLCGRERRELLAFFWNVHRQIVGEHEPDAYILLDIEPAIGLARKRAQGEGTTRFEMRELAFHERVRQGFLDNMPAPPRGVVIDAARSREEVYADIFSRITALIGAVTF